VQVAVQWALNAIVPGPLETPLVDGIGIAWKPANPPSCRCADSVGRKKVAPVALLLASDPGGNLSSAGRSGRIPRRDAPRAAGPRCNDAKGKPEPDGE
jgi:hypothetical protein